MSTHEGAKTAGPNVKWLSAVDITPWQTERLLPVCVSVSVKEHLGRTCAAVGVNPEDFAEVMAIAEREGLKILTEDDMREMRG